MVDEGVFVVENRKNYYKKNLEKPLVVGGYTIQNIFLINIQLNDFSVFYSSFEFWVANSRKTLILGFWTGFFLFSIVI